MPNIFLISDTHFGHANIITFKRDDGTLLRDFKSVEEMDEHMVSKWNSVVRPQDRIYHLGDVVMNRRCLPIMSRLNGHKVLIRGNHDLFKLEDYTPYFEDLLGVHVMQDMILSHIPIHSDCLTHRFGTNVHGHLHSNRVLTKPPKVDKCDSHNYSYISKDIDHRYICISVEHINYTPISLEELRKKIKEA